MSNLKSIHAWLLEVLIYSENEPIFFCDVNNLTLQIIFDTRWTAMNMDSKLTIPLNNSRNAPSSQVYLGCRIEETSCPRIRCIICHQILYHPSENGTSSMGKHMLPKAHIAMLHESMESVVSELTKPTVDETAFTILM
jgi:hypothetical protein